MPRLGFKGRSLTAEDRAAASTIRTEQSGYATKVLREIDHLAGFMTANPMASNTPRAEVFALFGGQWINEGFQPSTLQAMLDDFKAFRVDPFNLEPARQAVEDYGVANGVMRLAAKEPRRARVVCATYLPGISGRRPAEQQEQDRQAFWALLCITGNRAANVLTLISLTVGKDHIRVHWGVRKVRSNTMVEYLFAWSERPPGWILDRWAGLATKPWPYPPRCNIASAVNAWLKRWGLIGLTSTSPREKLDQGMRTRVRLGSLLMDDYAMIMDHIFTTSLTHYNSGVEA